MNKKLLFLVCFGFNYGAIKSIPPTQEFIERSQKPVQDIRYTSQLNFYNWWRNRDEIKPILEELNEITRFIRAVEEKQQKISPKLDKVISAVLNIFHDEIFTTMKTISLKKWPIGGLKRLLEKFYRIYDGAIEDKVYEHSEKIILCIENLYKETVKFFDKIINRIITTRDRVASERQEGQYDNNTPTENSSYFRHFNPDNECP